MSLEDELSAVTFKIYLCLVKSEDPLGPRDVMRMANITSPGVAHRGLQKLVDLGLAEKDAYSRYFVKEKINVKGHVWLGKSLVPRLILLAFFFSGLLMVEIAVLILRLFGQESIEPSYTLLMTVTTISFVAFLFEGIQLRHKIKE